MSILLAIVALSFLIIIHELGHFLVAKAFKVKVNEFSLFMGPKLLGFQKGETTYSLRLIPLGGYVKMEGEEEVSEDDRAFNKKPVGVRAAIIAAGPIMNILIALIFAFIIMAQSGFYTSQVKTVLPGSVAEQNDIRVGDTLQKYNGKTIYQVADLEIFAYPLTNESVNLQYERNGETKNVTITPNRAQDGYMLGFTPKDRDIDGADSNVVSDVSDKSPGKEAGLKEGDRIIELNGVAVSSRRDLSKVVDNAKQNKITITVNRDGKVQELKPVVPIPRKTAEWKAIGIKEFEPSESGFVNTLVGSFNYTISTSRSIYYSLGWLFTKTVPVSDLSGPIGITSIFKDVVEASQTVKDTIISLLSLTAMISINLGLVNLLPFPALDGSKLILLLIEKIRKKALNPEKEAFITMVGFVILIALMIYVTFNDILRII